MQTKKSLYICQYTQYCTTVQYLYCTVRYYITVMYYTVQRYNVSDKMEKIFINESRSLIILVTPYSDYTPHLPYNQDISLSPKFLPTHRHWRKHGLGFHQTLRKNTSQSQEMGKYLF